MDRSPLGQTKYRLSDEQLEYQVTDRLSFMRFLGVLLAGDVPDARTVWAFRDAFKETGLVDLLFARFNQALADLGVQMASGQIIDTTFVPVPIQRNSPERNALIKVDAVPVKWGKNKAKLAQKDIDARWTKKGGQDHYGYLCPLGYLYPLGYKNHINIDRATKLIAAHACTSACVHDSQVLDAVLRDSEVGGKEIWADSAYRSAEQEQSLEGSAHHSQIHERAYRNKPLTETQEMSNTEKSRIRARVEHVFGYMENSMGGIGLRTIGMARAAVGIGMMNLVFTLCRVETLIRYRVFDFDRIGASNVPQMA